MVLSVISYLSLLALSQTQNLRFLTTLEDKPGISIMADRGFTIKDMLKELNIDLNQPPFMEGKQQLSAEKCSREEKSHLYAFMLKGRSEELRHSEFLWLVPFLWLVLRIRLYMFVHICLTSSRSCSSTWSYIRKWCGNILWCTLILTLMSMLLILIQVVMINYFSEQYQYLLKPYIDLHFSLPCYHLW